MKVIKIWKKEVKLSLLALNNVLLTLKYMEYKKCLSLLFEIRKVAEYKNATQNSNLFIATGNKNFNIKI